VADWFRQATRAGDKIKWIMRGKENDTIFIVNEGKKG
jgi:hypothetical protein